MYIIYSISIHVDKITISFLSSFSSLQLLVVSCILYRIKKKRCANMIELIFFCLLSNAANLHSYNMFSASYCLSLINHKMFKPREN